MSKLQSPEQCTIEFERERFEAVAGICKASTLQMLQVKTLESGAQIAVLPILDPLAPSARHTEVS